MEECLINTGVTACVRGLINYIKLHPMMNPLNNSWIKLPPRIQQASAKLRNVFVKALLWC